MIPLKVLMIFTQIVECHTEVSQFLLAKLPFRFFFVGLSGFLMAFSTPHSNYSCYRGNTGSQAQQLQP